MEHAGPARRIPTYLGQVHEPSGRAIATCFQLAPGVLVTAFHVLQRVGAERDGQSIQLSLLAGGGDCHATVVRVDPLHDLAVLRSDSPFPSSVQSVVATDSVPLGTSVVVTGLPQVVDVGHEYLYLDATGTWQGGTTRADSVALGRLESTAVMPGMSGAPVRRQSDDAVLGVVSGRYNSVDGWLQHSVWVARTEYLQSLTQGVASVSLAGQPNRFAVTELTLTITDSEVHLLGPGMDLRASHRGMRSGLANTVSEIRRRRAEVGATRSGHLAEVTESRAVALGRAGSLLAESFLPEPLRNALASTLADAESRHAEVTLGIASHGEFRRLPWEALPDPRTSRPLALHPLVRMYRWADARAPASVPGPLRILIAIAAPADRHHVLDYENELRAVLAAVRGSRQGDAQVRIVPFATTGAIREALSASPAHVLHLSGHGAPHLLVLEDDEGSAREITADEFVEEAIPPGRMPAVVALAACYTDVATAADSPSFGARIAERGASVVIATETSITDRYATRVFSRTYERLAQAGTPDAVGALADSRRQVQRELTASTSPRDQKIAQLDEWAVLSVLSGSGSCLVFDPQTPCDEAQTPPAGGFAGLPFRPIGEFVGRREELRRWPIELVASGASGLVLHGIGGIGKTTLASELAARVRQREPRRLVAVLRGEQNVDSFLDAIAAPLRRQARLEGADGGASRAVALAARSDVAWRERLSALQQDVLSVVPLLIVLDNFEDNLHADGDEWRLKDATLERLLDALITAPGVARVLVTSRHPFRLGDSAEAALLFHHLGPLTLAETLKLAWSMPSLDRLDEAEMDRVWRLLGGHPRSLEYLDALLTGGRGRFPDVTQRLTRALGRRLPQREVEAALSGLQLETAIAETIALAADDVLLGDLLSELDGTPGAERFLLGVSVYREPVDRNAALFQVGTPVDENLARALSQSFIAEIAEVTSSGPTGSNPSVSRTRFDEGSAPQQRLADLWRRLVAPRETDFDLARLMDVCARSSLLTLVGPPHAERFFVHRWTAERLHARWRETGEREDVLECHRRAAEYWLWRTEIAQQEPATYLHDVLEARYHLIEGEQPDRASRLTERLVRQLHMWGAWDLAASLIHETLAQLEEPIERQDMWSFELATIALDRGELDVAEERYRKSLLFAEQRNDRVAVAASLHQLGNVAQLRGDLDQAEDLLHRSLGIERALRREGGIARSLHQLGLVAEIRGRYLEARDFYAESLAIKQRVQDTEGMISTYAQLGNLALRAGDVDEAERIYRSSLELSRRIGQHRSLAVAEIQLGIIARKQGRLPDAETAFRAALAMSETLGSSELAVDALFQLASSAQQRRDLAEAERLYGRALALLEQSGGKVPLPGIYHQLGVIARWRGDRAEASNHLRQSIEAAQALGQAQAVADGLYQLAVLAREDGDVASAEALLDDALAEYRVLGDRSGEANVHYQLAGCAHLHGAYDRAASLAQRSLELHEELGNRSDLGPVYQYLGALAQLRGSQAEARVWLERALSWAIDYEHIEGISAAYHHLALLRLSLGDLEEAERLSRAALDMSTRADYEVGIGHAHGNLGVVAQDRGDVVSAENSFRTALDIWRRYSDRANEAVALSQLAGVARSRGDAVESVRLHVLALGIRLSLNAPEAGRNVAELERIRSALGAASFSNIVRELGGDDLVDSISRLLGESPS